MELKNGGFLRIQSTEALTVIDVNTGAYIGRRSLAQTVLDTNLEAAREIARQLRLRDVGGAVIVDFIDMHEQTHRLSLLEELRNACRSDRTPVLIHGITKLGLVEMTRRRTRQPLSFDLMQPCPLCRGEGEVLQPAQLLRSGLREARRVGGVLFVREELEELAAELADGSGVAIEGKRGLVPVCEVFRGKGAQR